MKTPARLQVLIDEGLIQRGFFSQHALVLREIEDARLEAAERNLRRGEAP